MKYHKIALLFKQQKLTLIIRNFFSLPDIIHSKVKVPAELHEKPN